MRWRDGREAACTGGNGRSDDRGEGSGGERGVEGRDGERQRETAMNQDASRLGGHGRL